MECETSLHHHHLLLLQRGHSNNATIHNGVFGVLEVSRAAVRVPDIPIGPPNTRRLSRVLDDDRAGGPTDQGEEALAGPAGVEGQGVEDAADQEEGAGEAVGEAAHARGAEGDAEADRAEQHECAGGADDGFQ